MCDFARHLVYILISLSSLSLQAQHKAQPSVAGIWELVALEIPTYEELMRQASPEQKQQYRKEIATLIRFSSFEFRKDGTYSIYFAGSREEGKWRLDTNQQRLWIQRKEVDGSLAPETFIAIEKLDANEMILLNDYETGEIIRMRLKISRR